MTVKEEYEVWYMLQAQEMCKQRTMQGISQTKLAEMIGCSLKTIQNIENYKHKNYEIVWCGLEILDKYV
jgi:transcriptional regulator with XRE-family HTH domain